MKWLLAGWKQLWVTLLVAVVMVTVYVAMGRLFIPLVKVWQPELEHALQSALGQPVSLQVLEGDWRSLFPVVRLRQLSIGQDGGLRIARVEVELDPARSLYRLLPVFRRIEVDGVSAYVSRREDGWYLGSDWLLSAHSAVDGSSDEKSSDEKSADPTPETVADTESVDSAEQRPVWLRMLELQRSMEATNWHVVVESRSGNLDQLRIEQLRWRHRGNSQSVTGDLSWGRKQLARTRLSALLHGQLWPWKKQSGKVFLDVEPQSWASWIPDLPDSLSLPAAHAGAAVWLSVEDGNLKNVFADVVVDQLDFKSSSGELAVRDGHIQVAGKHSGKDWHLRVKPDLGEALPFDSLLVSSIDLRGRQAWQLGIPDLDVGQTRQFLVEHTLLPARIHRYLANLKPEGHAEDVRVSVLPGDELQLDVRTRVRDVAMKTYVGIPGLSNMAGEIHLSPRLGRFDFTDQSPTLNLSGVYDQPWKMDSMSGTFRWLVEPGASQIWLENAQARSAGLNITTELSMYLPARSSPQETRIRLLLGIPKASAADKARLLPDLLEEDVRRWIDEALLAADLNNGAFMLDGVLDEGRPDLSLTTQLSLGFDRARLKYLSDWPELENLKGQFYLHTPNLSVDLESGSTLGGRFVRNSGKVRLKTGKDKVSWLTVSGHLRGSSDEAFQYFRDTPIQQVVENTFDSWYAHGRLDTALWLRMPLVEAAVEPHVRLNTRFYDNHLAVRDLDLNIGQLNGRLTFDSRKGLFSESLSGELFGGSFNASIDSTTVEGNTRIALQGAGRAHWSSIKQWMPLFLLEPIQGDLGYQASLSIDTGADKLVFDVTSALDGTRINYPAPLNKHVDDTEHALNLRIEPGRETRITLNYDDWIRAVFAMDQQGLNRGQVYLGNHEPFLGSDPGVEVLGEVTEPILAEEWWAQWQALLPLAEAEQKTLAASGVVSGRPAAEGPSNPLRNVDLTLSDVTAWDLALGETHVVASQDWGEWLFAFESVLSKGELLIPADDEPLAIELEYLHLPVSEADSAPDAGAKKNPAWQQATLKRTLSDDALKEMMPGDLLPMTLNMKEFFIGSRNFGRWNMSSKPVENGMAVSILDSDLKGITLTGDFRWLLHDGKHETRVDLLNIKSRNLARVQKAFRQEVILEGDKMSTAARFSWQGSPMAFNTQTLDGLVSLKVENGTWKTEGAGALKAFGALNFSSISRRLKLDFSDLYQTGLAFDVMRAKANIEKGVLTFAEPLMVDGPGAKFLASGSTNLNDESLDMKFAVTFPVTDTLPLVAVLAGFAPQVAGAIYVTEKLIGDELEQFTSASYDVRGTWNKPDMNIRGAFDNEVDGKRVRSFKERFLSIFGLEESK